MNATMTELDGFQQSLRSCSSDESSLSIGRVKDPELKFESVVVCFKCDLFTWE